VAHVGANDGSSKWNFIKNGNSIQSSTVNLYINTTGTPNVSAQCMPSSDWTLLKRNLYIFLYLKLSPCCEYYIRSFERFPGFWILCANVSENSVCSIFIEVWRWNRVFRNVGTENWDARESPKRNNTIKYAKCMIKSHVLIK